MSFLIGIRRRDGWESEGKREGDIPFRHWPGIRRDPSSKSVFTQPAWYVQKGEGRGEKNGERDFSSFSSLPNPPPFSSPRLLLLTFATLALFTVHSQQKSRIKT